MRSLRLQTKLLFLVLVIIAVFLGALVHISRQETDVIIRKDQEEQRLVADAIIAALKQNMYEGRPDRTRDLLNSLRRSTHLARLDVVRRDGTVSFRSGHVRYEIPQVDQVFSTASEVRFQEQGDRALSSILLPLRNEGQCRRCHGDRGPVLAAILISHSQEALHTEIADIRADIILLAVLVIALTGGTYLVLNRKLVLAPLAAIHDGVRAISAGDLEHRIRMSGGREFREVAETMNRMAGQLQRSRADLERQVAERTKELDESFRFLGGIISSMPAGVLLLEMDGRVELINDAAAKMLQVEQASVVGQVLAEVQPGSGQIVSEAFEVADTGKVRELEYEAPDGSSLPVGISSTYYRGVGGSYEGLVIMLRDLSDLRLLQEELIARERYAAVGKVVAGVAHEVRNPLFGISSIGEIFDRELTDPGHRELVRALLSESRRLKQLVDDLLFYSRPVPLQREPTDLGKLWDTAAQPFQDEAKNRGVRIQIEGAEHVPMIGIDPAQVRTIFQNLIRNSLDASPSGTTIMARVLVADRALLVQVSDQGSGIAPEHLEKVFDPFFTTKARAAGLGLSTCRKIAQDHGGDITISSAEQAGTVVTVRFPR